jgi:hypothetical protein
MKAGENIKQCVVRILSPFHEVVDWVERAPIRILWVLLLPNLHAPAKSDLFCIHRMVSSDPGYFASKTMIADTIAARRVIATKKYIHFRETVMVL